ncbi:enoyl-CoA hydratase/isomerase family protein [Streptomyces sp. J2-1]|uniref:enoyl-CoA hydratase/isomerase family protein n=1 Tax=Streptomyces corallincola TaxID=2851888 RepID=UPI001C380F1A|nr:enoyl-CoA hydratase/isomerase family protein [Streptomyces corallincola]MBV2357365.1 enoyl-CoA hydratase/isomerase family protein [Streptomyces corallincola]
MSGGESVLTRVEGRAGHIVLNRPRALNALNHEMVRRIARTLDAWEDDPAVETVVVTGAGERGLCAGGDIRAVHDDARDGDGTASAAFWYDEYHLNARIARCAKPYVAVMDGITMGGGVGISAHGDIRIVTERSRVAMPETGIGFVPDVGGTHLLSRAPGELGTHLALTGAHFGAGDAVLCGLADHFVPSEALPALLADLAALPAADAVARHARPAPEARLAAERGWTDTCYAADTVEEILDRLRAHGDPGAERAAETLLTRSPTALKVTLAALRRARRLGSLEEVLDQEYRVSCAALDTPDLVEGVRAQIIDKDRQPRWNPAGLSLVADADVDRFFAPRGAGRELGLAAARG